MDETTPSNGRRLGRYTLFGTLATGGMAQVHVGRIDGPAGFSRIVAVKRVRPELVPESQFMTMLADEARLSARIQHPNVVSLLDVIEEGDELFLAMEYVHGESLARLLDALMKRGERAPLEVTGAIMAGALRGLHAAHEAKDSQGNSLELVHRDLSPHNILVDASGKARILDFGVAKARGNQHVSTVGSLKGKLSYVAPEQVHGKVSRRSDLFSMGAVFWELLAGERLFRGDTDGAILAAILLAKVESASAKNPTVSHAVDDIVRRSLSRRPENRYATALEFAKVIEATIDVASPSEVARWLHAVAGDTLASRERQVSAYETAWVSDRSVAPEPSVSTPTTGASRTSTARRRLVLGVAAGILVAALTMALRRAEVSRGPARLVDAVVLEDVRAVEPSPTPSAVIVEVPVSSGSKNALHPPNKMRAPVQRLAPAQNCALPYTVDETGKRKYKRECLPERAPGQVLME